MNTLSKQLDEAMDKLDYHREQLVYWRQRKQQLEQQIPQPKNVLDLVKDFFQGITDDNRNR